MTDWTDRMTPILVKELRQGIRSHLFTGSFLLIQGLLFLFGLSFILSDSLQQEPAAGAALFWSMLVLPLLVLVPASSSQSIENELKSRTLELLLLTRLSSHRIVLGKWFSTAVQTTLLLVSALPYVILRYFLGGIDLWSELRAIGILLLASALLSGIAMGFWSLKLSRWAKWGLVLFVLWLSPWFLFALFAPHGGFGMPAGIVPLVWFYAVILLFMMLESAAGRIGPPSENHASRVRLLALVALGAALLFRGATAAEAVAAAMALLLVVPVVVGSLNESTRLVERLYRPFLGGSRLRRMLLFPFAPSWPGGAAFALVALVLVPFLPVFRGHLGLMASMAIVATFLFPAALLRSLVRRARTMGFYLLLLVLTSVPLYAYAFVHGAGLEAPARFLQSFGGLLPPLALTLELIHPDGYEGMVLSNVLLVVLTATSVLALVTAARREWARIEALPGVESVATSPAPGGAALSLGVEEGPA
jgi:ABC-type transport system involved in multi-copper enzyme maturation permease subunit